MISESFYKLIISFHDASPLIFGTLYLLNIYLFPFVSFLNELDRAGTVISEAWEDGQAMKDINAQLVCSSMV